MPFTIETIGCAYNYFYGGSIEQEYLEALQAKGSPLLNYAVASKF